MRLNVILLLLACIFATGCAGNFSNDFQTVGDGLALASPAIYHAIAAAHARGGGTVTVPAGRYRCTSIHLLSNVSLALDSGCTIIAAKPTGDVAYDPPEPNAWDKFQDFGHSHFHNSLIWGENLENVSILGPGRIDGSALSNGNDDRIEKFPTSRPIFIETDARDTLGPTPREGDGPPLPWLHYRLSDTLAAGVGNKAIALKNCRNVVLRDFSIVRGGHFAILTTGVDNLTIDHVTLDTQRDGMDIDCCQNVRVHNCTINSPNDDGLCLKSSYALGFRRFTENVTISDCYLTGGYRIGSVLDGSWQRFLGREAQGHTGRIKFGTESNGGFRKIAISNCVFDFCGGLAIESVDGAIVEDISVSNIVMHDIVNCPIFLRLGRRARGPDEPPPGVFRRISFSNIVASNCNWRLASVISGIPGHPIEDVSINNVHIESQGGGVAGEKNLEPPERERRYPEPNMFGVTPSYGLFVRHVKNISVNDSQFTTAEPDDRSFAALWDVEDAEFTHVRGDPATSRSFEDLFSLKSVQNLILERVFSLPNLTTSTAAADEYHPATEPADPILDKAF